MCRVYIYRMSECLDIPHGIGLIYEFGELLCKSHCINLGYEFRECLYTCIFPMTSQNPMQHTKIYFKFITFEVCLRTLHIKVYS